MNKSQFDLFNQPEPIRFNGSDYDSKKDDVRLTGQMRKIIECMRDQEWRTLSEIEAITRAPQASISAQLRHLRKERFGSNILNKRQRGEPQTGLFEYQLILNSKFKL